jgi:hypothetical protein
MVFIDGSHHYDVAAHDFSAYSELAMETGIVVMHDINDFPNHPDLQVHLLWPQLQRTFRTAELIATPGESCGTGIVWL